MARDIITILKEDERLRRLIELNLDTLTSWSRIENIDLEHFRIRDKKFLVDNIQELLVVKPKDK